MNIVDVLLDNTRAYILDLDGTTYLGNQLIEGARTFIDLLQEQGIGFLFLTNNSSKHPRQYLEKLFHLGISVPIEKIFTSGMAAAFFLKKKRESHGWQRLFVLGTTELEEVFLENGFEIDPTNPQVVILGFDTTLTYGKLWKFCSFVREGLPYLATHADINCPIPGGYMPDAGALIALVKASTGREPDVVIGKPNRIIIEMAAQRLGMPISSLVMVGDRLYTDIALGASSGITTVLVLSGETQLKDLAHSPYQPHMIFNHLGEMAVYIKKHCGIS